MTSPRHIAAFSRTLTGAAATVMLSAHPAAILAALEARPGEALTAADFFPERKDVGALNLLKVQVCHIRAALVKAGDPRVIETVRGVGYRLVAPPVPQAGVMGCNP